MQRFRFLNPIFLSERDDGKWMRTDGNKRKAEEESEESRLEKDCEVLEGIGQDGKQEGVRQSSGGCGSAGIRGERGG